jgi:taurine dioxygenase
MDRSFEPLTPQTGTEIAGVDLGSIGPGEMHSIRRLLKERLVLVFRNQRLAREQHKALARHFGTGVLYRHSTAHTGTDPEVLQLKAIDGPRRTATAGFRADLTSAPNPISTSLLYLMEPPEGGGDTVFANMYLAYETLSEPVKDLVAKLTAVHECARPWHYAPGPDHDRAPGSTGTTHPVVVKHPETGHKVLWVNRGSTTRLVGVTQLEGRHLLEALLHHVESNPLLHCRVRWRANTLVMWDNVAAQYFSSLEQCVHPRYGEWVSSVGHALEAAR